MEKRLWTDKTYVAFLRTTLGAVTDGRISRIKRLGKKKQVHTVTYGRSRRKTVLVSKHGTPVRIE